MDRKAVLAMMDQKDLRLLYEVVSIGAANMGGLHLRIHGNKADADVLKMDIDRALAMAGGK